MGTSEEEEEGEGGEEEGEEACVIQRVSDQCETCDSFQRFFVLL